MKNTNNLDSESEIERLESEFPRASGAAFAAARQQALAAGLSVYESEEGFIYEIFPDGRKRLVKEIAPSIPVTPGTILIIP
jgi:hypothetical protein